MESLDSLTTVLVSLFTVLFSAGAWKFYEKDEMREQILSLTSEVSALQVKVEHLEKENERLKNI